MKKLMFVLPVFLMISCITISAQAQQNPNIAGVNVDAVAAVANDGTVYLLKEFKVDTITEYTPEDVEMIRQKAANDTKEIDAYYALYNKPGATDKEKKHALKGIEEILDRRAELYLERFDARIKYVEDLAKDAKDEMKYQKKNKKMYVKNEAQAIADGVAPRFRLPVLNETEKQIAKDIL